MKKVLTKGQKGFMYLYEKNVDKAFSCIYIQKNVDKTFIMFLYT